MLCSSSPRADAACSRMLSEVVTARIDRFIADRSRALPGYGVAVAGGADAGFPQVMMHGFPEAVCWRRPSRRLAVLRQILTYHNPHLALTRPPLPGRERMKVRVKVVLRCRVGQAMAGLVVDNVSVFFLAEGEQTADEVMARLTTFIRASKRTLDFAIYDMRFSDPLHAQLAAALRERAGAGVKIRFCYDADKPFPPNVAAGQDPAPSGTGAFVQSLGYPWRRIAGMKLMHSKFIVRDGQSVWAGSANMTDDAFTLMENNIVEIDSQALANHYAEDFEQLWEKENFENTGQIRTQPVAVSFAGKPAEVRVMFSPGCGLEIDSEIARRVRAAQRRVRICSLLINSGTLINELGNLLRHGAVAVDGIYDRTQMEQVYVQWQEVPSNRWKIGALEEIIARAGLIGKNSTPYSATGRHNYMHNKVLVIDDTVITGSYNFSRSAQFNAENILFVESAPLANTYSAYIDHLKSKYAAY